MDNSIDYAFTDLHEKLFGEILWSMRPKVKRHRKEWEAYHLLDFATSIRDSNWSAEKKRALEKSLGKRGIGFFHLQQRTCDGYVNWKSEAIFESLAEVQDIPLLVCFLNFLEFCQRESRPLSVFKDKETFPKNIDELISDIRKHIETQKQEAKYPTQPHLTVPDARKGNPNYYANAVLDVIGRDTEKKRLEEFLNSDMNVAWLQLAGVAGQGKSRLAFDLIKYAINKLHWIAGLLKDEDIRLFDGQWQTWQPDRPHLIVFDYVIGREDKIKPILQILTRRQNSLGHDVRLLLVERQPWNQGAFFDGNDYKESDGKELEFATTIESYAEWFINLHDDDNDTTFFNARFENGVVDLKRLDEDDLVEIVKQISNKTEPGEDLTLSDTDIKKLLDRIDKSGRPLYAYFLGQELAYGVKAATWSNLDLLKAVLARERKRWWRAAFKDRNKPPRLEDDFPASRLAILATIIGGLNCEDAYHKQFIPLATAEDREQALALTGNPMGEDEDGSPPMYIPPMQPDLLGEWYVIASLQKPWSPLRELTEIAWRYEGEKAGAFMQKLYQDFKNQDVPKEMLDCLNLDEMDVQTLSKVSNAIYILLSRKYIPIPEKVIQALQIDANNGALGSMANLGRCYLYGLGVEKDEKKGLKYLNEASEAGSAAAKCYLGVAYHHGLGVEINNDIAFGYFSDAAKAGIAVAVRYLGHFYFNGFSVKTDVNKAMECYRKAANAGDAIAMYELGRCYETGKGIKPDTSESAKWYQKAADTGHPNAMLKLGGIYFTGLGVKTDIKKSIDYFKKAADLNETGAMFALHSYYREGVGVTQDNAKALHYLQKAADAGHAKSMAALARHYIEGNGVEKDTQKAFGYIRDAAEAGNMDAMLNLCFCYQNGICVEKDPHNAAKWLTKATEAGYKASIADIGACYRAVKYYWDAFEAGNTEALVDLGSCYEHGNGVSRDLRKAVELYEQAAAVGNAQGMENLGFCYQDGVGVKRDVKAAFKWFEKAAETGYVGARFVLGTYYEEGIGAEPDFKKALECYEEAAQGRNPQAMFRLGAFYYNGDGVEKDIFQAIEYFRNAADAGNSTAMKQLGFCYQNGDGVELDFNSAADYFHRAIDAGDETAIELLAAVRLILNFQADILHDLSAHERWAKDQAVRLISDKWPYAPDGHGAYTTPSTDQATKILSKYHRALDAFDTPDVLDGFTCRRIRQAPLSFYPNHHVADMEFVSSDSGEVKLGSAIVGPNAALPLNGRADLIFMLNNLLLVNGAEGRELEYLRFCWDHFKDIEGWSFKIVSSIDDLGIESMKEQMENWTNKLTGLRRMDDNEQSSAPRRFEVSALHGNELTKYIFSLLEDGVLVFEEDEETIVTGLSISTHRYDGLFRIVSD